MQTAGLKGSHFSLQQKRLWSMLEENTVYCVQCAVFLRGQLDITVFLQALRQMVAQREILRTTFYTMPGMNIPVQVIGHLPDVLCPIVDLQTLDSSMQERARTLLFTQIQSEPFDFLH